MTFQLLTILSAWFALGCIVAWLIGRASDIGGVNDIPVAREITLEDGNTESPAFANQCRQVRIVLARE